MQELFSGKFAPMTYTIGFLECDRARAIQAYLGWQSPIQAKRGVDLVRTEINGSLPQVLESLLPLTSVERRRFVFLSTASPWTAYLDNGHRSTDAVAPMSYLAESIGCRALRVTNVPENPLGSRYPARILEIYGPNRTHFLNYIRSISLGYDGQKWTFTATGTAQSFEQIDRYSERVIQDRFTIEMLDSYLGAMGLRAFTEEFYLADSSTLIHKEGPIAQAAKEFTLESIGH